MALVFPAASLLTMPFEVEMFYLEHAVPIVVSLYLYMYA